MKKAFTLIEFLIVIAVIAMCLALIIGGLGGCSNSTGSRVGVIVKISYKGIAWKSWEGEMLVGKGESANVWKFSIADRKIVEQVKQAMRDGHRVELEYTQRWIKPISKDTPYLITAVKSTQIAAPEKESP